MSTKYYKWNGTFKWARVYPDDIDTDFIEEGEYHVNFYPDDESWDSIEESGLKLKKREDDDGSYITLRRRQEGERNGEIIVYGPPKVYLHAEPDFTGKIGNGSKGTVNVQVYDGRKGKGHRLNAINVTELVEYTPGTFDPSKELPF